MPCVQNTHSALWVIFLTVCLWLYSVFAFLELFLLPTQLQYSTGGDMMRLLVFHHTRITAQGLVTPAVLDTPARDRSVSSSRQSASGSTLTCIVVVKEIFQQ